MGWLPIVNYTGERGGIMVDVSITTLHKRTGEGDLIHPLDQPLFWYSGLLKSQCMI